MKLTLGTNISAMRAQRQLSNGSNDLSSVFERLASGQRINRASDDAAGLAISESLNADARVYAQGVRNLNDGISVLNIADGALQELTNITLRLTELAEQAANGTLGTAQRASLDEEAQALKAEYFRIAKSTEFNGRKLFEASYGDLRLQAGYGTAASIASGLGGDIGTGNFASPTIGLDQFNVQDVKSGDFNGDGSLDILAIDSASNTASIALGNGNGTFQDAATFSQIASSSALAIDDFNNDGYLDFVTADGIPDEVYIRLGNGDGTFEPTLTSYGVSSDPIDFQSGDFNGDGLRDLVFADYGAQSVQILFGNGDGTFQATLSLAALSGPRNVSVADFNGDGIEDFVVTDISDEAFSVYISSGDGSFLSQVSYDAAEIAFATGAADINGDGSIDVVTADYVNSTINLSLNNGDGTFQAMTTFVTTTRPDDLQIADFNGDGLVDVVTVSENQNAFSVHLGNGDGSFQSAKTYSVGTEATKIALGDYNNDGVLDALVGDFGDDAAYVLLNQTTDGVAPLLDFSLHSVAEAKQALSRFQQKLDHLTAQRGQVGAFQSRIQVAERVLGISAENYKAAESRIRDADVARESAELVRLQILQQASAAVLGQANLQPQLVLQLLGGNS